MKYNSGIGIDDKYSSNAIFDPADGLNQGYSAHDNYQSNTDNPDNVHSENYDALNPEDIYAATDVEYDAGGPEYDKMEDEQHLVENDADGAKYDVDDGPDQDKGVLSKSELDNIVDSIAGSDKEGSEAQKLSGAEALQEMMEKQAQEALEFDQDNSEHDEKSSEE